MTIRYQVAWYTLPNPQLKTSEIGEKATGCAASAASLEDVTACLAKDGTMRAVSCGFQSNDVNEAPYALKTDAADAGPVWGGVLKLGDTPIVCLAVAAALSSGS